MAEKPNHAPPPEPAPKKKLPVKVIGIVAGLMALEAGGVFFLLSATGPARTEAATSAGSHAADDGHGHESSGGHAGEESDEHGGTAEVEVVSDKFQNLQTGRVWLWDASVFVQVKSEHAKSVEKVLERRSAEVREGVSRIFSRAQHAELKEPERQTLNRQLTTFLQGVLGNDADGKPLIERVIIPRCRGFPTDY
ncbi:MAG TPA: hypothetical protein VD963_05645 [Phycisphaerales bacterium]|nr:hypothetical protein [Phycisphaerales bacterium]